MTKVVPGISILAVVLPHRAPLALAQVRTPLLTGNLLLPRLCEALLLGSGAFDGVGLCFHLVTSESFLREWERIPRL